MGDAIDAVFARQYTLEVVDHFRRIVDFERRLSAARAGQMTALAVALAAYRTALGVVLVPLTEGA